MLGNSNSNNNNNDNNSNDANPSPDLQLVESIVTTPDDWLFNATGTLTLTTGEGAAGAGRDPLSGAGSLARSGASAGRRVLRPVRQRQRGWCRGARRATGWRAGWLAARGEMVDGGCVMAWPSRIVVPYRRYVVDLVLGVVSVFVGFPGLDRTQGRAAMPDSHLFRVEGEKIRFVHTASACVVDGCGLNGTTFGRRRGLTPVRLRV